MSMRAVKDEWKAVRSVFPRALATTFTGATIDLANAIANKIDVELGAFTDGSFVISWTDSADDTTYAANTTDIVGSIPTIATATATASVWSVSYIGSKRYLKPVITVTTGTTGVLMAIVAQLKYRKQPA